MFSFWSLTCCGVWGWGEIRRLRVRAWSWKLDLTILRTNFNCFQKVSNKHPWKTFHTQPHSSHYSFIQRNIEFLWWCLSHSQIVRTEWIRVRLRKNWLHNAQGGLWLIIFFLKNQGLLFFNMNLNLHSLFKVMSY